MGVGDYWEGFQLLMDTVPLHSRTEYTDDEFCDALESYHKQNIQQSMNSNNPLVRMFAILDRRIGKRTLVNVKESLEQQTEWLQSFYQLRLDSQNIQNYYKLLFIFI